QRAVSEAEWRRLYDTNMLQLPVTEFVELKRRLPVPGTTNVSVADWLRLKGEGQFRAELLNLTGRLDRVVIVLDASASMNDKGRLQIPRWTEARAVIEAWLKYLPIQQCGLIVFSDTSESYTTNRAGKPAFWPMGDEHVRANLIERIRNRK